ncbi:cupin domain-containing protein [Candidatus Poriferisocius sp.]|uniref:cupin domain-containing protein n=1 Tax=Candidatus Poriferisocius sp. TaxID=3101276 RepID=UPI003B5C6120
MGQREDLAGLSGAEVVAMLGLVPLPEEGGMWREVWRDERSTAIYFLIRPGDFSAMHRLDGPELRHHYAGAAVQMLLLGPDGLVERPVLGDDLEAGERPCVVVPAHTWMGASTQSSHDKGTVGYRTLSSTCGVRSPTPQHPVGDTRQSCRRHDAS